MGAMTAAAGPRASVRVALVAVLVLVLLLGAPPPAAVVHALLIPTQLCRRWNDGEALLSRRAGGDFGCRTTAAVVVAVAASRWPLWMTASSSDEADCDGDFDGATGGGASAGGGGGAGGGPPDTPRRRQRRRKRRERRAAAAAAGGSSTDSSYVDDGGEYGATNSLIDAGANAAVFREMLGEDGEEGGKKTTLQETLSGGPSLIFAMARRMLVWDDEGYVGQNDTYRPGASSSSSGGGGASSRQSQPAQRAQQRQLQQPRPPVLPRWHPHPGISDVNPSFRRKAPVMNNAGYLGAIRRNARKRTKPSLWRYSLRVYDRMRRIEAEQARGEVGAETAGRGGSGSGGGSPRRKLRIKRTRGHHEGALVACAKLGLWREALRIYGDVVAEERDAVAAAVGVGTDKTFAADAATVAAVRRKVREKGLGVTDNMVMALVRACIRGSKAKRESRGSSGGGGRGKTERRGREPLDAARDVVLNLEEEHGVALNPRHVNPLAAAYQYLGLRGEASELLRTALADPPSLEPLASSSRRKKRSSRQQRERDQPTVILETAETDAGVATKDRASYSLLVGGAVVEEDWAGAVEALKDMTEAGMYPTSRSLNIWNEASEKGERKGRNKRSWRKRRDEYWLDSVR